MRTYLAVRMARGICSSMPMKNHILNICSGTLTSSSWKKADMKNTDNCAWQYQKDEHLLENSGENIYLEPRESGSQERLIYMPVETREADD